MTGRRWPRRLRGRELLGVWDSNRKKSSLSRSFSSRVLTSYLRRKSTGKGSRCRAPHALTHFFFPIKALFSPLHFHPLPLPISCSLFLYTSSFVSSSTPPHPLSIFSFAASPYNPFLLTWWSTGSEGRALRGRRNGRNRCRRASRRQGRCGIGGASWATALCDPG